MHQTGIASIIQSGREITPEEIGGIKETVRECGWLSRTTLTKTICEHRKWFTASG